MSQGAFAERLNQDQRKEIHIPSDLDDYLNKKLSEGKQVILTGNPGDGKTQYILMQKQEYEGFFLKDASTWELSELIEEWNKAYENEEKGIIAINDGPLQQLIHRYKENYDFLEDVDYMMENQALTSKDYDHPNDDMILIDLSKRSVLSPIIVKQAITKLTNIHNIDEDNDKHISYNAAKLSQEDIKSSFGEMLTYIGGLDSTVTMRDLLNFIAFCINGGKEEEIEDFDEELKFYNLAYSGRGKIFDLFREHINPRELTHPHLDSILWSEAEKNSGFSDTEYNSDSIEEEFLRLKRKFMFGDKATEGIFAKEIYNKTNESFLNYRNNDDLHYVEKTEQLIGWMNSYFIPSSDMTNRLLLWFSHNFRSKENKVIISRGSAPADKFRYKSPKLNPVIEDSITYNPNYYVLEYDPGQDYEKKSKIRIDKDLHQTLSSLDLGVPYIMRDENTERKIMNFMEEVEKREIKDEIRSTVRMKDTESGEITKIKVNNDEYSLSGV